MKYSSIPVLGLGILALVLLGALLAGCAEQTATEPTGGGVGDGGVLDTAYENALDVTSQLALGTLNLEETDDAVTKEQAAKLLPLWQALDGSALKGDGERNAVLRQIEATMTEDQVSAIAAMQLTGEDVRAWAQSQGERFAAGGGGRPGGGGRGGAGGAPPSLSEEQMQQMRQQFQNMSPEERATRRAQFGGQGGFGSLGPSQPGGTSRGLTGAVIALLAERGGVGLRQSRVQAPPPTATAPVTPEAEVRVTPVATAEPTSTQIPPVEGASTPTATPEPTPTPTPSPTPEPVVYVVRAGDSLAAVARAYGVSVDSIVEANELQDPDAIEVGQELVILDPSQIPAMPSGSGSVVSAQNGTTASQAPAQALEQVPDSAPGPPFTVEVSAVRAIQDPLVEKSQRYQVSGIVRNGGDQMYAVSALHITFFDAEGFRGSYYRFPGPGRKGGEWIWHGITEADMPCLLLAPGEECPFRVEITAQNMASFLIHPDAAPTGRESAPIGLSEITVSDQGTDYLRIGGTATNGNPFKVKNVTVSGVLRDASGQIVSMGWTYVLQEDIAPGESVRFDLRVEKESYVSYQLYAQAERDWK